MVSIIEHTGDLPQGWQGNETDKRARKRVVEEMNRNRAEYEMACEVADNVKRVSDANLETGILFEGKQIAKIEFMFEQMLAQRSPLYNTAEYDRVTWDPYKGKITPRNWVKKSALSRLLSFNITKKGLEDYAKQRGKTVAELTGYDLLPLVRRALHESLDTALVHMWWAKSGNDRDIAKASSYAKNPSLRDESQAHIARSRAHLERQKKLLKALDVFIVGEETGYATDKPKTALVCKHGDQFIRPHREYLRQDIEELYKAGVSIVALMGRDDNEFMTKKEGLSPIGMLAVKYCFRFGMGIDLSLTTKKARDQIARLAHELEMVDHLYITNTGIHEQVARMGTSRGEKGVEWNNTRNVELDFLKKYIPLGLRVGIVTTGHFSGDVRKGVDALRDQAAYIAGEVFSIKGATDAVFSTSQPLTIELLSKDPEYRTLRDQAHRMYDLYAGLIGEENATKLIRTNLAEDVAVKFIRHSK